MRKIFVGLITFFTLALLITKPSNVFAQTPNPIEAEIIIGLEGQCKLGTWMPVFVTLENSGDDFVGDLIIKFSDADYKIPVNLPKDSIKSYSHQIYIDQNNVSYEVSFRLASTENNKNIALEKIDLNCHATRLIGVLSDTPSAFTVLNDLQPAGATDVIFLEPQRLPDSHFGLAAMDILVIANADLTELTTIQHTAIQTWVSQGGTLILGGGSNWQTSFAGLGDLLPLQISGTRTTSLAEGDFPFDAEFTLNDIVTLTGRPTEGTLTLLGSQANPIVLQNNFGKGLVSLIMFDPNIPSFRIWDQLTNFYDYVLLFSPISSVNYAQNINDWYAATNAASSFKNLNLPSGWLVCGLLLVYIILIGPVNYLVLKSMNKRELAWFTIPAVITVFTFGVILLGWGFRGGKAQVNQLALVQQDGEQTTTMSGLIGVFSPRRDNYKINLGDNVIPYPFAPYYYYNTTNTEWIFNKAANNSAETRIDTAGIVQLGVQGTSEPIDIRSDLSLIIDDQGATLAGTVTNNTNTTFSDAVLLFPGGAEYIGDFAPNSDYSANVLLTTSAQAVPYTSTNQGIYGPNYYNYSPIYMDILFTENIYSDVEAKQQAALLDAHFGNGSTIPSDIGYKLLVWDKNSSPYDLDIPDQDYEINYATAYLIDLKPQITTADTELEIPPVFMNWYVTETSTLSYSSPYDIYFYGPNEDIEIYYRLNTPIEFSTLKEIVIHLEGDSVNFPLLQIWNFELSAWEYIKVTDWGDIPVTEPAPYSSSENEVRIRLESINTVNGISVYRADISLIVEP